MSPKTRSGKILGTVVTKKVIEETVEVVVSPTNLATDFSAVELVSSSTKQNEKVELVSSTAPTPPTVRNIVVEDSAEKLQQKQHKQEEVQQIMDREKRPREAEEEEEEEEDEDETQPADSQQAPPPPPPKQQPSKDNEKHQQVDQEGMNQESPDDDEDETQPDIPTPPREKESLDKDAQEHEEDDQQQYTKKRKATPERTDEKKKRRKKRAKVGSGGIGITSIVYKRYLYRVLKQVHPELGISSKAITIVNNMMNDMCERIAEEGSRLSNYSGRKTLSSWDIQDAVKLVLPGELGKHAIAEGAKAVGHYASSGLEQKPSRSKPKKSKFP